jgi:glycosyltransferase involved in cell wall biosynthesis
MLVRYYGHVGQESGYGDAGNEICMALRASGVSLEISTTGDRLAQQYLPLADHIRDDAQLSPDPDVILVHTLPLTCGAFLTTHKIREQHPKARCIAYTTWEGAHAAPGSAIAQSLALFDQVWVPSYQTNSALGAGMVKSQVVPHPFEEGRSGIATRPCVKCDAHHALEMFPVGMSVIAPEGTATVLEWSQMLSSLYVRVEYDAPAGDGRPRRGNYSPCELRRGPDLLERPYRFYYIGAWTARKNPEGVLRAFVRAFDRSDNVELWMQCAGAGDSVAQLAILATGVDAGRLPRIMFSNKRLSEVQIASMHAQGDCFVSASRGEAWNLPCFQAMLAGRHIIVPDYQGSDDFLVGTSAERYGSTLAPASGEVMLQRGADAQGMVRAQYIGTQGLTVQEDWREPDLSALAVRMRRAYVELISDLRILYDPAERFGRQAVARTIRHLLQGD